MCDKPCRNGKLCGNLDARVSDRLSVLVPSPYAYQNAFPLLRAKSARASTNVRRRQAGQMAHLAARIWLEPHCWRFATAMEASLAGATGDLWDVAPLAWSSVCCENAVVLAPIKDAEKAARPRHSSADSLCGSAVFFLKCLCDAHKNNDHLRSREMPCAPRRKGYSMSIDLPDIKAFGTAASDAARYRSD